MEIELIHSTSPVEYDDAYNKMQEIQHEVIHGNRPSAIWFLEHEEVITAGRRADTAEILDPGNTPLHHIERGGKLTLHNPGQRVVYFMLDLKKLHGDQPDIRKLIRSIESALIEALNKFGVEAEASAENIGIWAKHQGDLCKIASIGLSVKKWVTMHGIAININNDLSAYRKIVPCGLHEVSMTSMTEIMGRTVSLDEFDQVFEKCLNNKVF